MDWITRLRILCMVPACNSHDKKNGYQEMRTVQGIPEAEEKTEDDFFLFVFIKESLSKRDTAIHRYLETAATIAGIRYMIPF